MRYLSVCSGIEAATVAWSPLGWSPVAFAEIDPFACWVLAHRHGAGRPQHMPNPDEGESTNRKARRLAIEAVSGIDQRGDVPNLGDLGQWREWPAELLLEADVLIGGTPCQSFSVAGLRRGMDDDRGNLALQFVELADAIDNFRRAAGRAPCWIVWENVPGVYSDDGNAFGAFLAGLVGSDAPVERPQGRNWHDAGVASGPVRCAAWRVLDAQHFGLAQRRRRVFVVARGGAGDWSAPDALLPITESVRWHPAPSREARERLAARTAASVALRGRDAGGNRTGDDRPPGTDVDTADSLIPMTTHILRADGFDASEDGSGRGTPLVPHLADPISAREAHCYSHAGNNAGRLHNVMPFGALKSVGAAVRRLTPRECERLQGFPDDYTLIPYRNKPAADGPRYKALGNSMAVPVIRYLGERIAAVTADERSFAY